MSHKVRATDNVAKAIMIALLLVGGVSAAETDQTQNVNALIQQLRTGNDDERRDAAKALGDLDDTLAVKPLIASLNDPSCYVRGAAAKALGNIGDSGAIEPLLLTLNEQHWVVRGFAAYALGKIGDARVVEPLIVTLANKKSALAGALTTWNYQREGAAWSLGEIGDARAVEPLIAVLEDPDPDIRLRAALSLGKLADPSAVDPLIKLAQKDSKDSVRAMAAWSLAEIGTDDATAYLSTAFEKKRWPVIAGGYLFFIRQGKPGTEALLIKALKKYGTKKMATTFSCCGHPQLEEAGREWAEAHSVALPAEPEDAPKWGGGQ